MKTIPVLPNDSRVAELLNEARVENLILTLPDGSEFILAEVDTFAHEVALTRGNQALMALLAQRAKQTERVSLAKAKELLGVD